MALNTTTTTLEEEFVLYANETPEFEAVKRCIQCGTCAGSCPAVKWMDYSPRKVFGMLRSGLVEPILKSRTPWICASCYLCTARCPKNIKITDIMYALKRFAIKENIVPQDITGHILIKTFTSMVFKYGRNFEAEMMTTFLLKTNPFSAISLTGLALSLYMHQRMEILPHRIKAMNELSAIIKKAELISKNGKEE